MRTMALCIIALAFLVGSLLTVIHPSEIQWPLYLPVLLLGAVGVGLMKRGEKQAAQHSDVLDENIHLLAVSLANIVRNLTELQGNKLPVYEARFEIDRLFREDLINFAEARKAMSHKFGLQHYADVMSGFAAGERYINRVWSASTDGYVDEVTMYLGKAQQQFIEAKAQFDELLTKHA